MMLPDYSRMFPDYHFISGFLSINPVHSKTKQKRNDVANKNAEHYPDSQVILWQELRMCICRTISVDIVNACFDHHYSTAVLAGKA